MSMFHKGSDKDSDPSDQPRSMEEVELLLLRQNKRYHILLIGGMLLIGLAMVGLVAIDVSNGTKTTETLEILQRQTSPARQEKNDARLQGAILQIDCNNRDAIDVVIQSLKDEGLLSTDIAVITTECEEILDE